MATTVPPPQEDESGQDSSLCFALGFGSNYFGELGAARPLVRLEDGDDSETQPEWEIRRQLAHVSVLIPPEESLAVPETASQTSSSTGEATVNGHDSTNDKEKDTTEKEKQDEDEEPDDLIVIPASESIDGIPQPTNDGNDDEDNETSTEFQYRIHSRHAVRASSTSDDAPFARHPSFAVVSAGATHTAFVTAAGKVHQMGTIHGKVYAKSFRSTMPLLQPHAVSSIPPQPSSALHALRCLQIASGRRHILALMAPAATTTSTAGSFVLSWGAGHFGQLGHGPEHPHTDRPRIIERLLPNQVGGHILHVAAGAFHSGAIVAFPDVGTSSVHTVTRIFTWGFNRRAQCGVEGGRSNTVPYPTPVLPASSSTSPSSALRRVHFSALALGRVHSVALSSDGEVYTWGSATHGRLGLGASLGLASRAPTPTAAAAAAAAAAATTSATPTGGGIMRSPRKFKTNDERASPALVEGRYAVASPTLPQPPASALRPKNYVASPKRVEALRDVRIVQICAGDGHTLALSADGRAVYSWGYGADGQLGLGHVENSAYPRMIRDLDFGGVQMMRHQLRRLYTAAPGGAGSGSGSAVSGTGEKGQEEEDKEANSEEAKGKGEEEAKGGEDEAKGGEEAAAGEEANEKGEEASGAAEKTEEESEEKDETKESPATTDDTEKSDTAATPVETESQRKKGNGAFNGITSQLSRRVADVYRRSSGGGASNAETSSKSTVTAESQQQQQPPHSPITAPRIVSIHASGSYSAAVSSSGDLYTWGYGESLQLGHPLPTAEAGLPMVEQDDPAEQQTPKFGHPSRVRDARTFESRLNVLLPRRVECTRTLGLGVQSVALGRGHMMVLCAPQNNENDAVRGQTLYELEEERKSWGFRLLDDRAAAAATLSTTTPSTSTSTAEMPPSMMDALSPASTTATSEAWRESPSLDRAVFATEGAALGAVTSFTSMEEEEDENGGGGKAVKFKASMPRGSHVGGGRRGRERKENEDEDGGNAQGERRRSMTPLGRVRSLRDRFSASASSSSLTRSSSNPKSRANEGGMTESMRRYRSKSADRSARRLSEGQVPPAPPTTGRSRTTGSLGSVSEHPHSPRRPSGGGSGGGSGTTRWKGSSSDRGTVRTTLTTPPGTPQRSSRKGVDDGVGAAGATNVTTTTTTTSRVSRAAAVATAPVRLGAKLIWSRHSLAKQQQQQQQQRAMAAEVEQEEENVPMSKSYHGTTRTPGGNSSSTVSESGLFRLGRGSSRNNGAGVTGAAASPSVKMSKSHHGPLPLSARK